MADNVTLPVTGQGTPNVVQATEDIGGVQYPLVKLVSGADDATAGIPGDATNGLDVDVTRVQGNVQVTNGGTFAVQSTLQTGTAVIGGAKFVDESGVLYGVKHISNKPRVSAMPYLYDIAEGNVTGHTAWTKIGFNDTVGTSQETMWTYSSEYVFPTAASQVRVVSSDNTQDKAGGTGALTVRVGYLKSDYSEGSVTLTLNGTANVDSGAEHADIWRVNSFRVMTTGTNLAPVGNLTLTMVTGGGVVGYIRAGKTRARSCLYTVPLGKTLYVTSIAFSAVGTKYMLFTTHANYDPLVGTLLQRGLFHPFSEVALLNSSYSKDLLIPTKLIATTDLKVSVVAEAAGSIGTCHLRGWIE